MTLPFLYQLQNASYSSLSSVDFHIAVVDQDDSNLSASQVQALNTSGKQLLAYTSIGEAEDYRSYWSSGNWDQNPPSFLLGENPNWAGNYLVKFWDPAWQKIVMQRVDAAIANGYDGIYLDIVDAYTVSQVRSAYSGTDTQLRQEMINFVIAISDYAKAKSPGFMVVPQNAVGLLANTESNPGSGANTAYLNAIDGLGVEDLWYDGNSTASWTSGDLQYIQHAVNADKFVLATSYPTDPVKQAAFIVNAINAGLIPFATDRNLTGQIPAADGNIEQLMSGKDIDVPWLATGGGTGGSTGGGTSTTPLSLLGDNGDNLLNGAAGDDSIGARGGNDSISGGGGGDTVHGGTGSDRMHGDAGNDLLVAGDGRDSVWGDLGQDELYGGRGNDTVDGGVGNDTVQGGEGQDLIIGGTGNDVLYGGLDADMFQFTPGSGDDVVKAFQDNVDTLQFTGYGGSDAFRYAQQQGRDVVFNFANGDSVVVENATIAQLQDDLIFS